MQIVRFNTLDELQPYAEAWDRLSSSVPFRSWTWLSTWWRHYGEEPGTLRPRRELFVLAAFDEGDAMVGLAPWYIESTAAFGSVVRMLGTDEIYSDYLTMLSEPGFEEYFAEIVAEYLTESLPQTAADFRQWDRIELTGIDGDDRPIARLADSLRRRACTIHRRSTVNCWRIDLPTDWESYLASLSKKFRQEVRRLERKYFESGKAVMKCTENASGLAASFDLLVDLHQRRRRSLGESGCYASEKFAGFLRAVSPLLLREGQMQIHRLEIEGKPVGIEYQLIGGGVVYAYQTGIDPEAVAHQPGKLTNLASIRRAIEGGHIAYDFLRGDEPYKAHFRATPRASLEIRIIPDRPGPQFRHKLWLTGSHVKKWFKTI